LSITTASDAPNCSVTYDCHYDDRNSFIIQATGQSEICCQKTTIFHQNMTAINSVFCNFLSLFPLPA
jgi:hypothetical protein